MKRLQRMIETECGEEAINNIETGVLAALRTLCAALERKRPDAFRHVARQATRAPSAMLRSDTALAELALALARRITRENITWSKVFHLNILNVFIWQFFSILLTFHLCFTVG